MSQNQGSLIKFIRRYHYQLLIAGIMLLAIFMRFYQLNHLPPGLHPDEAANGLDIFRILEKHDWRVLYNTNGPREALFFYLQALSVAIFGNTILALRLVPAIIGTLAVLATWLWAQSWFGRRVAVVSAFLMAVTPWAVTFSRDGFRASMIPLFLPLTLWLLTLAWQRGKHWLYALAGLALGLGAYTYLAWRLFPLALLVLVGALAIWRRKELKRRWQGILISLVAAIIALVPLGIYAVRHPADVGARAAGTSFLNRDLNHGQPLQTLADSVKKTVLMFNLHGDENFRHNLGGEPELNVFVGLMFILGILICLTKLTDPKYLGLLVVWAVMLLPAILTAESLPHALRSIGALAPSLVLAALGISYMLNRWYATFPINSAARTSGLAAIVLLLGLTAYQGYTQYFVAWASDPRTYAAFSEDATNIASYLIKHGTGQQNYVVIDGYSDKTIQYLTHNHTAYTRLEPADIANLPQDGQAKLFIVGRTQRIEAVARLKDRFAGGHLSVHYSSFNDIELFYAYEVTK